MGLFMGLQRDYVGWCAEKLFSGKLNGWVLHNRNQTKMYQCSCKRSSVVAKAILVSLSGCKITFETFFRIGQTENDTCIACRFSQAAHTCCGLICCWR